MAVKVHLDPEAPDEIRKWRTALGLSRQQAAVRFGLSAAAVSNWELSQNEPKWDIYLQMMQTAQGENREWFARKLGLNALADEAGEPPQRLISKLGEITPESAQNADDATLWRAAKIIQSELEQRHRATAVAAAKGADRKATRGEGRRK